MFLGVETILVGVLVALVLIGIIFAIWYISTSNELKRLEQSVEESESGIDVALAKRYDSLTKMLDTTKGYAKHEAETLSNVIKWRNGLPKDATLEDKKEFASQLSQVEKGINVVVEQYPQLKADSVFAKLQSAIMDSEEHLQAARRLFNSNVKAINNKIVSFPSSWVAKKINMSKKEYFEVEEVKRQDVKMEF